MIESDYKLFKKGNPKIIKACKICDAIFTTRNPNQICCSEDCTKENRRQRVKEHYERTKDNVREKNKPVSKIDPKWLKRGTISGVSR